MSTFAVEAANSYMGRMMIIFLISIFVISKKAVYVAAGRDGRMLRSAGAQLAASNYVLYLLFDNSSNLRAIAFRVM